MTTIVLWSSNPYILQVTNILLCQTQIIFIHVLFSPSVSSFPECLLLFFLFSLFLPHRRASSRFYDVWKILDYNSSLELRNYVSFPSLSLFVYECLQASRYNTSKMASLLPLLVLKLFPIPSVFTTIKLPW